MPGRSHRTRVLAVAATAGTTLAVLGILYSEVGGGQSHTLRAAFQSAVGNVPGEEVRLAGRKVGSVGSVDEVDGEAVLRLNINDGSAWPLPRGTVARIRWGSTSGYANRYVELDPGPASAPSLPNDGVLSTAETVSPVELDQIYRIFRGRTRGDLQRVIEALSAALRGNGGTLARAVRGSPIGLEQGGAVLQELGADPAALSTLVKAGDRTAAALAARDSELGELVEHTAGTFNEFADHAAAAQAGLSELPATLNTSTETLRRLDRSLSGLQALVDDLGPGAASLRSLAPVARDAVGELRQVAPKLRSTLMNGRLAAAPLGRFLAKGTEFLPRLGDELDRLAPMVGCLRPYGPEIAGTLSNWTGFEQSYDSGGHYNRALFQQNPIPVGTPLNSQLSVASRLGAVSYAMPRPPGLNEGQPWFQPQCGAGPESLDVSKDPENNGGGQ